jgi:hypothetical protein
MMFFLIAGCDFSKNDRAKADELALSFAYKYTSKESKIFNEAWTRRYISFGHSNVTYDMPEMNEFSIESCSVSEWQGVKNYKYTIAYKLTEQENNKYANVLRTPWVTGPIRKIAYLTFTIEKDSDGNLRLGSQPVIWIEKSGRSLEEILNYSKKELRKYMY